MLGFYDKEVTLYIYRETIILTLLGILVGFLTGDWLYGAEDKSLIARPALHSYELWLHHPLTDQLLHITAPLPEDMRCLL